jgi:hypothetical protein
VDSWLDRSTDIFDLTPRQIANNGGAIWEAFIKDLRRILSVLRDELEEPAEDFGLPVSVQLRAMRSIHLERARERQLNAEEAARREESERAHDLERFEVEMFSSEQLAWLDVPNTRLQGISPRAAAMKSTISFKAAIKLISEIAETGALKTKWVSELRRRARLILQREDMVEVYMKGSDPDLPNLASPEKHTIDEHTMSQCLDLLKRRHKKR